MIIVVSHLAKISDKTIKKAEKVVKKYFKKNGVVILAERRDYIGRTDLSSYTYYCKLQIWNGDYKMWEDLLIWVETNTWGFGFIGKDIMENLGITGIWLFEKTERKGEQVEAKVILFAKGEMYFSYTYNGKETNFYDFKKKKSINVEKFLREFQKLAEKVNYPLP